MKRFIIFPLILVVGYQAKHKTTDSIINNWKDMDSVQLVERTTFCHAITDYEYCFFGEIGYRDRGFSDDTLLFPPIEGLAHQSCYVLCPNDTCFGAYATLAIKCPPKPKLLDWVSREAKDFVNDCPLVSVPDTQEPFQWSQVPFKHLESDEAICHYYMEGIKGIYRDWICSGTGDHDRLNSQLGLLLMACWNSGDLYTIYESSWYDMQSCGDPIREAYRTVNAITGEELTMSDLVKEEKLGELEALMIPRLINDNGIRLTDQDYLKYQNSTKDVSILEQLTGCALIEEGLILYFYPYILGCGADGEYEAIIPYSLLDGFLRI